MLAQFNQYIFLHHNTLQRWKRSSLFITTDNSSHRTHCRNVKEAQELLVKPNPSLVLEFNI